MRVAHEFRAVSRHLLQLELESAGRLPGMIVNVHPLLLRLISSVY